MFSKHTKKFKLNDVAEVKILKSVQVDKMCANKLLHGRAKFHMDNAKTMQIMVSRSKRLGRSDGARRIKIMMKFRCIPDDMYFNEISLNVRRQFDLVLENIDVRLPANRLLKTFMHKITSSGIEQWAENYCKAINAPPELVHKLVQSLTAQLDAASPDDKMVIPAAAAPDDKMVIPAAAAPKMRRPKAQDGSAFTPADALEAAGWEDRSDISPIDDQEDAAPSGLAVHALVESYCKAAGITDADTRALIEQEMLQRPLLSEIPRLGRAHGTLRIRVRKSALAQPC